MLRCSTILSGFALTFGAGAIAANAQEIHSIENGAHTVLRADRGVPKVEDLLSIVSDAPVGAALDRLAVSLSGSAAATTTSLKVSVESYGSNLIIVAPGAEVGYEVAGVLSNDANEGLALVGFNLVFDGGALTHVDIPVGGPTNDCDNPMTNFTLPWGITNPDSPCPPACGFGGTIIDGNLVQVGGAQNTINNTPDNAAYPIGPVLTGVAQPSGCGPAVLATGRLTAPDVEGVYILALTELFANIIREGETGEDFWVTDAAGVGMVTNLVISVDPALGVTPVCLLPPDPGPCEGICPRFFYNCDTGRCESLEYGCCGGNANNFLTSEECRTACRSVPTVSQWGMVVMVLLLFGVGAFMMWRNRAAPVRKRQNPLTRTGP
ncbi:MAG: IPTL-CTERM sorting domain-containing protein [Phycisphaerales bacterium]|nr:MAG: IPTL-CTERM sorting domain-containing protein [Phycisphaerales bacterium]